MLVLAVRHQRRRQCFPDAPKRSQNSDNSWKWHRIFVAPEKLGTNSGQLYEEAWTTKWLQSKNRSARNCRRETVGAERPFRFGWTITLLRWLHRIDAVVCLTTERSEDVLGRGEFAVKSWTEAISPDYLKSPRTVFAKFPKSPKTRNGCICTEASSFLRRPLFLVLSSILIRREKTCPARGRWNTQHDCESEYLSLRLEQGRKILEMGPRSRRSDLTRLVRLDVSRSRYQICLFYSPLRCAGQAPSCKHPRRKRRRPRRLFEPTVSLWWTLRCAVFLARKILAGKVESDKRIDAPVEKSGRHSVVLLNKVHLLLGNARLNERPSLLVKLAKQVPLFSETVFLQ